MADNSQNCSISLVDIKALHTTSIASFVVVTIVLILGLAGNVSLIIISFKEKQIRDINNAFIINLAFSDFLLLIWFVPSTIFENFLYFRPFGRTFCYIQTIVTFSSHDVSILSLVALSYIRYRAVLHPLDNYTGYRTSRIIVSCLAIWTLAISTAVFPAVGCQEFCIEGLPIMVHILAISQKIYTYHMVRCVVLYIIPLTTLCILYSITACKLIRGNTILQRNQSTSAKKALNSRNRLGIIVIALIVIFAVGWLPRYVQIVLANYFGITNTTFNQVVNIFMALGSSLNPYALYAASSMYRLYFRNDILVCLPGVDPLGATHRVKYSAGYSDSPHVYKQSHTTVSFQDTPTGGRRDAESAV